ncbi:hypothetical protein [Micromonospora ureilytica]|uniref:hypothetical protein n=1 Tax=Micromonospora ureilytica TaxID=709868 RepID=UPI00403A3FEF
MAVLAHRTDIAATRTARQVEQHRTVDAVSTDHDREVVAAGRHPNQLRDAAGHRLADRADGGVGFRRVEDGDGQRDQSQHGQPGECGTRPPPGRRTAGPDLPAAVEAARRRRAQGHTDDHGYDREHAMKATSEHERHDAVGATEMEPVDQRPDRRDPRQLEHGDERDRRQQHGPPGAHDESGKHADEQTGADGGQRVQGGDRSPWCRPSGYQAVQTGGCDCRSGADTPPGTTTDGSRWNWSLIMGPRSARSRQRLISQPVRSNIVCLRPKRCRRAPEVGRCEPP